VIILLRGASRVIAAITGLLLAYGFIYAMEGMTTRLPMSMIRELAITTLLTLPWTLLAFSGFDDFAIGTKRPWVFWSGSSLLMCLIYNYERHTASTGLTKALMPLLASIGGVLPHVFRRISLLYAVCSVLAGLCGIIALYFVFQTFFSSQTSFASRTTAFVIAAFVLASVGSGILTVASRLYLTRTDGQLA
jgi:hypothetical protein